MDFDAGDCSVTWSATGNAVTIGSQTGLITFKATTGSTTVTVTTNTLDVNEQAIVKTFTIVLLVILVILIVACVVLYFVGKKAEKKQADQQAQLDAVAQTVSILVIDKGRMKLKEAGLPDIVIENTPKYLRRSKVPVVKAKVGPKIMTLMCDAQVYPLIPVKKEVKATISGIYITAVKGVRGPLDVPEKKKGFFARLRNK